MRVVIAPEPSPRVYSDPHTRRVCLSAWLNVGATSIGTELWLSADQALDVARRLTDAAADATTALTPAAE